MKKNILLVTALLVIQSFLTSMKAQVTDTLTHKEQSIVAIAAFTAKGEMPSLKLALDEGLTTGLAISEIKEVLVQLYAYAGFPRSLNALTNFMEVLKDRQAKGIKDEPGKQPSPLATDRTKLELGTDMQTKLVGQPVKGAVYEFAPAIDQFLKEHLFGDIFGRDNLDFRTREIATIAALAGLGGAENQLRSHFGVGMYNGVTDNQAKEIGKVLRSKVGATEGASADKILQNIFADRKKKQSKDSSTITKNVDQRLKITVGKKVLFATLTNGKTTQDFIRLLPLTLTTDDICNREKYSGLVRELSKEGAVKKTYDVGDIAYWLGGGRRCFF